MNIKKPYKFIPYKKYPDKYFDWYTDKEFIHNQINEHPRWYKYEYDNNGNTIYYENSASEWHKYEYNNNGKIIYAEDNYGYWYKREYDINGNEIFFEDSRGYIKDNRI